MDKTFVWEVEEKEAKEFLGIFEMKNTLESLVMIIAENNAIDFKTNKIYSIPLDC